MLLEGYGFDGPSFLECECLTFIVALLVLRKRLPQPHRVVKTDFFRVLVDLGPDPPAGLLPSRPHLHLQVANHLNDHYYIPVLTN